MAKLDINGVLCDYSMGEVMAFDADYSAARARLIEPVTVEEGLRLVEDRRRAVEQSPLAKLIPGYYRLP